MNAYNLYPDPAGVRDRTAEQALLAMIVTANSLRKTLTADAGAGRTLVASPGEAIDAVRAKLKALDPTYTPPVDSPVFKAGSQRS